MKPRRKDKRTGIHAASLKARRMRNLFNFMKHRGQRGATSIEMDRIALSPSTAASELRAFLARPGSKLPWRMSYGTYEGLSPNGRKKYRYVLERVKTAAPA